MTIAKLTAGSSLSRMGGAPYGAAAGRGAWQPAATGIILPMACGDCACISQYQYNIHPDRYQECMADDGSLCGCFSYNNSEYCLSGAEAIQVGKGLGIPATAMAAYFATSPDGKLKKCVRDRNMTVPVEIGVPATIPVTG